MGAPGDAWLVWSVEPDGDGAIIHQDAYFQPRGLFGRLYWFFLLPFHGPIFQQMLNNIASAAEHRTDESRTTAA